MRAFIQALDLPKSYFPALCHDDCDDERFDLDNTLDHDGVTGLFDDLPDEMPFYSDNS